MKNLVYFTLSLLFSVVSSRDDVEYKIQASYDYLNVRQFDFKSTLTLTCNVSPKSVEPPYVFKWAKNNEFIEKVTSVKGRVSQLENVGEFTLKIASAQEEDAGNYTCMVWDTDDKETEAQATIIATSLAYVKLPTNLNVVEEDTIRIHCQVVGKPTPNIVWKVLNETYDTSLDRVQLLEEDDVPRSLLVIEKAVMSDRGMYKCMANDIYTNKTLNSAECYVRVKDKLAALWPFIGICAEVIVLCAIICIYEKKHNKSVEMEESDTDQSPDQKKNDHSKNSDVRFRK